MAEALAEILNKAPLTAEKLEFAWRAAVGPALNRATTIALADGILRVSAKDVAWRKEVARSKALIRARLDALLGPGVVRAIEVSPSQQRRQT